MQQRKQAFIEYQNELRVREREENREYRQEARKNFLQMLEENRYQLDYLSKYFQFQKKVLSDYRFKACDDRDRDEIF